MSAPPHPRESSSLRAQDRYCARGVGALSVSALAALVQEFAPARGRGLKRANALLLAQGVHGFHTRSTERGHVRGQKRDQENQGWHNKVKSRLTHA